MDFHTCFRNKYMIQRVHSNILWRVYIKCVTLSGCLSFCSYIFVREGIKKNVHSGRKGSIHRCVQGTAGNPTYDSNSTGCYSNFKNFYLSITFFLSFSGFLKYLYRYSRTRNNETCDLTTNLEQSFLSEDLCHLFLENFP